MGAIFSGIQNGIYRPYTKRRPNRNNIGKILLKEIRMILDLDSSFFQDI